MGATVNGGAGFILTRNATKWFMPLNVAIPILRFTLFSKKTKNMERGKSNQQNKYLQYVLFLTGKKVETTNIY